LRKPLAGAAIIIKTGRGGGASHGTVVRQPDREERHNSALGGIFGPSQQTFQRLKADDKCAAYLVWPMPSGSIFQGAQLLFSTYMPENTRTHLFKNRLIPNIEVISHPIHSCRKERVHCGGVFGGAGVNVDFSRDVVQAQPSIDGSKDVQDQRDFTTGGIHFGPSG